MKGVHVIRLLLAVALTVGSFSQTGAQQPSDNLAGEFVSRVAYKYHVRSSSNSVGHIHLMFPGSLSLDGKQLLINDFKNSKLVLIDVDSLNQETISSDPRILSAWFDSQIEAIFVLRLRDDVKIGENRKIFPTKEYDQTSISGLVDLYCFGSLAEIRNDQPSWMRPNVCHQDSAIHWMGSHSVFVIHEWRQPKNVGNTTITILSKAGDEIGQFEIPGQFLGVDSGEEDLELFHVTWNGSESEVGMSSVSSKLKGLKKTRRLYTLQWHNRIISQITCWESGTRGYRLRGLKQGDVRRFITQVMSQPGYWFYEDITSLQFTLGWNPLARLSPMHRQQLLNEGSQLQNISNECGRFINLGKIDALETAQTYEFVHHRGNNSPGFLVNHLGQLQPLAEGQNVLDAVNSKEGLKFVTISGETSRMPGSRDSEYTYTISVHKLDQNANQRRGLK